MKISPQLHQKIVEVVAPIIQDVNLRSGIMHEAFMGTGIAQSVQWQGNPKSVATNLVDRLIDYGEIDRGKEALTTFLETAIIFAGQDNRTRILSLLDEMSHETEKSNGDTVTPLPVNTPDNILLGPVSVISRYSPSETPKAGKNDKKSTLLINQIVCSNCGTLNEASVTFCVTCYIPLRNASDEDINTHKVENMVSQPLIEQHSKQRSQAKRNSIMRIHFDGHREQLSLDLSLYSSVIILGRRDTNFSPDLDLSSFAAREKGVSRKHLSFVWQNDQLCAVDLNSANGTWLNREALVPHQPKPIRGGDKLTLGRLVFIIYFDETA